ncbi:MAG TPA: class I SAM-dependent methyltransferase, partial [Sphingomonadales bacterium]|nr:class I SAM-dependent methyltransferase [Sphingomonadales bacterium]
MNGGPYAMDEITRQAGAGAGQADEGDVFSYDLVPYHSLPFAGTHPNHLAAIATIFGMKPPAIETCRILEMACASGGNIIPMAAYLPGCEAVGIDLSARQIEEGEKTIKALGLKNIELRCHGIQDISAKLGKFDYIIAHGVYSWVTDDVRKKIVAVCKENLTENGVAYVSYNTYPGWHMPQALREMMLYHTAAFKDHKARVGQARAFLRFLFEATK